jgi:hypothetical protein
MDRYLWYLVQPNLEIETKKKLAPFVVDPLPSSPTVPYSWHHTCAHCGWGLEFVDRDMSFSLFGT